MDRLPFWMRILVMVSGVEELSPRNVTTSS
jgi:hypothetical protein